MKAVIAQSFERIHRSNLIGMGILPCEFMPGETLATHGLDGTERYDIEGVAAGISPKQTFTVRAVSDAGKETTFQVRSRIDTVVEGEYYKHGGILPFVLRQLLAKG